jgi:hypothetical protein
MMDLDAKFGRDVLTAYLLKKRRDFFEGCINVNKTWLTKTITSSYEKRTEKSEVREVYGASNVVNLVDFELEAGIAPLLPLLYF